VLPSGAAIDELTGEQQAELVELMCELLADHVDAAGRLNMPSTCNLAHGVNPRRGHRETVSDGGRLVGVGGCCASR
jgi:hypothetical protein